MSLMAAGEQHRATCCPHCGKAAARTGDNPWRPFCSERCKLIDLGDWLCERFRVPTTSEETWSEREERHD